jgi:hypothetical protein
LMANCAGPRCTMRGRASHRANRGRRSGWPSQDRAFTMTALFHVRQTQARPDDLH